MHPTQKPAAVVEPTPADLLRFAALYLRRHGWTRGGYYEVPASIDQPTSNDVPNPTPACCALGAIAMAVYGTPVLDPFSLDHINADTFRSVVEVLRDHLVLNVFGPPEHPEEERTLVPDWNDDYAANVDEVIETLEAAAHEWDFFHRFQDPSDTEPDAIPGGAE